MVWFYYCIFGIISFSLLLIGFLSYFGNVVLVKLVSNGWLNNFFNVVFILVLMFGYFIGLFIGGFIGDYFGWCRVFCINFFIVGIVVIGVVFVFDMYWFIFFCFLMGIGMGVLIMVGYVLFMEFIFVMVCGKWFVWFLFVGNWLFMLFVVIGVVVIVFFSW